MLKIREYDDNGNKIDLKELGKYGFKELEKYYVFNDDKYDISLWVNKDSRKVMISSGEFADCEDGLKVEPKLYDLIKADLVEKCGDDNED